MVGATKSPIPLDAPPLGSDDSPSMPDIQQKLTQTLQSAMVTAFGDELADADPLVKPSANPKFGDYQANAAMSLGKKLGQKPRDVAQAIVDALGENDLFEKVEIAGPGFINLTISSDVLASAVSELRTSDTLGLDAPNAPQTIVVDYSGPNVAKEMHVGHLRSSIIGDSIVRVLTLMGHKVIRQNHLGDWGTQFGMLIEYMIDTGWQEQPDQSIGDLNELYQNAKKRDDTDDAFAERARKRVVALQSGDPDTLKLWQALIEQSKKHFNDVYGQLGVLLTDEDIRAESAYNDDLASVVDALQSSGLLNESQGANVVYPDGFKNEDGDPLPMIVQKSDGGYLYATTDLAAARYRIQSLGADRIVYVTDARQADHFKMIFWTLRKSGWADDAVRLDHVPFGTVLGNDRKPIKTREGDSVKLISLVIEAEQHAAKVLGEKSTELSDEEQQQVAHVVGVGALKYADLSSDRIKDYVFDWDRMLAMEGNTAPYLQNAYVRIQSIFRKSNVSPESVASSIAINEPAEKTLALKLLQIPSVIHSVADSLEPHRLCNYLYDLASSFHQFYEKCSVLNADSEAIRDSRLLLCDATARTLKTGLSLLGIDVVERM